MQLFSGTNPDVLHPAARGDGFRQVQQSHARNLGHKNLAAVHLLQAADHKLYTLPPLHRLETILNNQHCRTMILQRTATTPLTSCLSPRVHSSITFPLRTRPRQLSIPGQSRRPASWGDCGCPYLGKQQTALGRQVPRLILLPSSPVCSDGESGTALPRRTTSFQISIS